MNQQQVYEDITNKIITMLDAGTVPWKKTWQAAPINYVSKKAYRGVNIWLLYAPEYKSNIWLTYNQAKNAGGHILKGSKGRRIILWKWYDKTIETEDSETETKRFALMREYTVFNIEQTNIEVKAHDFDDIKQADDIVNRYQGPAITYGGNKAYYRPSVDVVCVPHKQYFGSVDNFYSTLFHELTHSTGHEMRLNRPGVQSIRFGSDLYSSEELVAEMGAAFLCTMCDITNTVENSAAYIQHWRQKLSEDHKLVVKASSQAQKAVDYITNGENYNDR